MANVLRVGVAQMFIRPTLKENLDQTLKMIGEVRDQGCDVAVFGENNLQDQAGTASASDFDAAMEAIRERAIACDIHVVVGVTADAFGLKQALVVNRAGETVLNYHKNTEVPQRIYLDDTPCSVSICSDRWYIEHADLACLTQGSKVMIDISGGHGGDDGRPDLRWVRYRCWAIRNSTFVVVCNLPHHDEPDFMGNAVYGGHSAILDPEGRFLAKARYEKDFIIHADLNTDLATRENAGHRRNHPIFKSWWSVGKKVLEGGEADACEFIPLESQETETVIAAAQIDCSGDVNETLSRIDETLRTASDEGAHVVVFPERTVDSEDADLLASSLDKIQALVRKNEIAAILGMPFREGDGLFNSALVIDPTGRIRTRYDQISARGRFAAGRSTQAMWFEINGAPATVTIGDDLYWPELTELAAYRGMQLHFHLEHWQGTSRDAQLVRKQSAVNHLAPGVCGVWVNAAEPGGSGGSLLLRRTGGHNRPNPGDVEAYLPYHTSVVQTAGSLPQMMYLTAKTGSKNGWQAWRNQTRKNERGHGNWWYWIQQGVQAVHESQRPVSA